MIRIVAAPDDVLTVAVRIEASRRGLETSVLSLRELVEQTSIWRDDTGAYVEPDVPTLFRPHMVPASDPESDEAFLQGEYWAAAVSISQFNSKPFLGRYGYKAEPHLLFPPKLAGCNASGGYVTVVQRQQWLACGRGLLELASRDDLLPWGQSILDGRVHERSMHHDEGEAIRTSSRGLLGSEFSLSYVGCVCGKLTEVYSTFHGLDSNQRARVEATIRDAASKIAREVVLDMFALRFAVSKTGDAITLVDADPFPPQYPILAVRSELASLCMDYLLS